MRGDPDPQEEEDQLHPAADRGAGEGLLWHQISWHLPAREAGGSDRAARVKNPGNYSNLKKEDPQPCLLGILQKIPQNDKVASKPKFIY